MAIYWYYIIGFAILVIFLSGFLGGDSEVSELESRIDDLESRIDDFE